MQTGILLQRYWFQALLLSLAVYVLLKRDISIQIGLSSAGLDLVESVTGATLDAASTMGNALAMPTALHSIETPNEKAVNVATPIKKAIPKDTKNGVPIGNTMSNLTPILSPNYAKRKGIDQAIVDAKIELAKNYVQRFAPVAIREMQAFNIPASITLAQGLLESNVGESRLSTESNNHFGIKCRSKCRSCTCRNYSDDSIFDMFRVFDSAWESYREHSKLLASARYKHLTKHGKNYRNWAHGLKKAGYATDPNYAEKIIQIIEFLDLHEYDSGTL
ncbi:MAG: glycoside hydrolase family 73 protein [Saprospiraceae bacterium]